MTSVNFAQPDVTLKLDLSGVIRRAVLSNAVSHEEFVGWVGRPWAETVAGNDNVQVIKMIDDARAAGVSPYHRLVQRFPSGLELSVEYTTVRLGGDGGLLAIGRSLEAIAELRLRLVAAQMSMERDYWKLRDVETRYRLLFDASSQPVLLISADQLRVVEANPAAIRTLGVGSDNDLLSQMLPAQREAFRAMLQRVREQGKAPGIVMHLGQDRHAWLVRASLVAAEPGAVFVLQLSEAGMAPRVIEPAPTTKVDFEEIVDRLPHGHVVLDAQGKVLSANRAFLEMVGLMEDASAVGAPIARWLGRSEAEASILLGTAESLGAVTEFPSTIRGNEGRVSDVAISVVRNADAASNTVRFGVLLRPVDTTRPAAVPPLGRVSLREIIQTTVASVERRCIEAALEQAGGNRTIAAQMLGLSRQALYLKLNRYTQGEEVDGEPA